MSHLSKRRKEVEDPDADTVSRTDAVIFFKNKKRQDSEAGEGQSYDKLAKSEGKTQTEIQQGETGYQDWGN